MRNVAVACAVALFSVAGCKQCGKPDAKPREEHLAFEGCQYDALRVYALFDATVVSFTPLRFGIVTAEGLDTSISAGFAEEVARTGRAEPDHAKIRAITGRRDDVWVVLEAFGFPSSDVLPPRRLLRRRADKWEAIPSIETAAVYDSPALYRGGAIAIVRQLGTAGEGTKIAGIGLPADVDAAKLFPDDIWGVHALDSGHVVADAASGLYLLGPTDAQARRLRVPTEGSRSFTGATRARFRVRIGQKSYRLEGENLVLAEQVEEPDAEVAEGRSSSFEGHDGELFTKREEANKLTPKTTLMRERRPKEVVPCPDR